MTGLEKKKKPRARRKSNYFLKMPFYEPAEDSLLLSGCIEKISRRIIKSNPEAFFLDMGAGSGIQSDTALKSGFKKENILAADISREAISVARKKGFTGIYSDLFSKIKGKFDLISFNPPYLPDHRYDKKKDTSGGKEGYETVLKFIKQLKPHLSENGKALLLVSSLTQPKIVKKEIARQGLKCRNIDSENLFFEKLFVMLIER